MVWLENFFKSDDGGAWQLIISAGVLVVILIVLFWIFRKILGGSRLKATKNRVPRLSVTDSMPVDETRHLVLFRRDNLEHLVLIGGPSDVVIETGIVRIQKNNQNSAKNGLSPMESVKADEIEADSKSPSLIGAIGGVTAAGVGGVTGALSKTTDVVSDTGSAVVDKTSDAVSATVDTTTDAAKAVGNKTTEVASAAVETTKDAASATIETTKDVASKAVETTNDAASATIETTKDVASKTVETTKDAIKATTQTQDDSIDPEPIDEPQIIDVEPEADLEDILMEHLDQELSIDTPQSTAQTIDVEPKENLSSKDELQKLLDELAN